MTMTTEETTTIELEIRPNNCCVRSWCALCGGRGKEAMVDLYLVGTYDWVCTDCGIAEAPDLAAALMAWWRGGRPML